MRFLTPLRFVRNDSAGREVREQHWRRSRQCCSSQPRQEDCHSDHQGGNSCLILLSREYPYAVYILP